MHEPLPDVAGAPDFRQASERVLAYLRRALPMTSWSITRVANGRQTHLYLDEDNGYGLRQGASHPWEASLCVHMASGAAPAIAPDARAVPLYARAGVNATLRIGAYAGAPVREADGSLFGAVCGLDHEARTQDRTLREAGPVLALLGQLLTMALAAERSREDVRHQVAQVRAESETDALTSVLNRRGWERHLRAEVVALQRLADPAVVAVLDLDGLKQVNDSRGHAAGDDHLRRAARALMAAVHDGDLIARLGGDEFGVLLRQCDERDADGVLDRITTRLAEAGVAAAAGWAPVTGPDDLAAALHAADAAMYAKKHAGRPQQLHRAR